MTNKQIFRFFVFLKIFFGNFFFDKRVICTIPAAAAHAPPRHLKNEDVPVSTR